MQSRIGRRTSLQPRMNARKYETRPQKLAALRAVVNRPKAFTAEVLDGDGLIPLAETMWDSQANSATELKNPYKRQNGDFFFIVRMRSPFQSGPTPQKTKPQRNSCCSIGGHKDPPARGMRVVRLLAGAKERFQRQRRHNDRALTPTCDAAVPSPRLLGAYACGIPGG